MKLFLDFDDTLFDTRAFIDGMKVIFEECGISKELFQTTYQEIKTGFNQSERTYDFDAHISKLQEKVSFDDVDLRNKIHAYLEKGARFLFPDVQELLSLLKKKQHHVYILSFGTSEFQADKIAGTGIMRRMEKTIITTEDKAEALQREINDNGDNTWFFDDRMRYIESVKRAFPKIRTVLVRRDKGRYHDEPNEFCDYVVKGLEEVEKIIEEQIHTS